MSSCEEKSGRATDGAAAEEDLEMLIVVKSEERVLVLSWGSSCGKRKDAEFP